MSEYYLADHKAAERARQREREQEIVASPPPKAADAIKVTLLGDFMVASAEPQGCDPYNSTNGKTARDAWTTRRDRR
jgi:hypothetical protein